jgi:TRAP-type C4-dicarboxylate transport system permease small subunit
VVEQQAGIIARLDRLGRLVENSMLVVLLTSMILLASSQIILRNFFDSGFVWADELLRILLLWTAMFGAVAASRENRQIAIDVLSRFLPGRWKNLAMTLVQFFTAAVSGLIAWHSYRFVNDSRMFEDLLMGDWPAWVFQSVIPLGFAMIAYRYLVFGLASVWKVIRGKGAAA